MARSRNKTSSNAGKSSKKSNVVFIAAAAVVAVSIFMAIYMYANVDSTLPAQGKDALAEVSRLAALNAAGQIQASDLAQLKAMVEGDHAAEHEVEEIEKLVSYGEGEHAGHTFAFLASYLETGKESSCPGHALAHYYVFSRHGESEVAEHALEDAKLQMEEWEHKAREFNEKFPGEFEFDYISDKVKSHMLAIEAGATQTTEEELSFLAEKTICVDSDMESSHSVSDEGH